MIEYHAPSNLLRPELACRHVNGTQNVMCPLLNGFLLIRAGRARIEADQIYDIGALKATTCMRRKVSPYQKKKNTDGG